MMNHFFLDYDSQGILTLYLKLFGSLAASVINGAPLVLVFRNPRIQEREITLYIYDVVDAPYYFSKQFSALAGAAESESAKGIVAYAHYFEKETRLQIAIFDELLKNIYTDYTAVDPPAESVHGWYQYVMAQSTVPAFSFRDPKENRETGYLIRVHPLRFIESARYMNIATRDEWGDKPYVVSSNKQSEWFDISNYLQMGQLGFLQEQNLREILSFFFQPNVELFASPKLRNGLELTDIVFGRDGHLVLIESKAAAAFGGTQVQVKTKENALTRLITKGCAQLLKAESILRYQILDLADIGLVELATHSDFIVKVCLVSDLLLINSAALAGTLSQYDHFELPIIMQVHTFYKILYLYRDAAKIAQAFWKIKQFLDEKDGLPILAGIGS